MIFQIFDNGDVVNTQTWEVLTLKTPSRHHKHFFFLHTLSPPLPGLPGIPSSPETPCKKKTIFADIKFVVIVVVLVSSAYKEGVLKYKGSKNRARENFSLFTGGIFVYERSVPRQIVVPTDGACSHGYNRIALFTILSISSVVLLSSWLSTKSFS